MVRAFGLGRFSLTVGLLLALGIAPGCKGADAPRAEPVSEAVAEQVGVDLFFMSKCVYGAQAVNLMLEMDQLFAGGLNLRFDYIGEVGKDGRFRSLHGQDEIAGNIRQLCVAQQGDKIFHRYLKCQSDRPKEVSDSWQECAKQAGADVGNLETCYGDDDQGRELLRKSFQRAAQAQAMTSPTLLLGGKAYTGEWEKKSLLAAVCAAMKGASLPAECDESQSMEPTVTVTLITDQRCSWCDVDEIAKGLNTKFQRLDARILDWSEDEAKVILNETGQKLLPVVLFDDSVELDKAGFREVGRWLKQVGPYRSLQTEAYFDPLAEICDNGIDDTGNGKVDCEDSDCKDAMVCRQLVPNSLELYYISNCEFGRVATDAMQEVLSSFGDELKFTIRHMVSLDPDSASGFRSTAGKRDVDESLTRACAVHHYGKDHQYLEFILCRNGQSVADDWTGCALKADLDPAVIGRCAKGDEGRRLLQEDTRAVAGLSVPKSPTWLVNNRHTVDGLSAESVREGLCKYNPQLKGCATKLSESPGHVHGEHCNH